MKNLNIIFLNTEDLDRVKGSLSFTNWLKNQIEGLKAVSGKYAYIPDEVIAECDAYIQETTSKILNLSEENIKIELFTRGGDIKETVGIGFKDIVPKRVDLFNKDNQILSELGEYNGTIESSMQDIKSEYLPALHLAASFVELYDSRFFSDFYTDGLEEIKNSIGNWAHTLNTIFMKRVNDL